LTPGIARAKLRLPTEKPAEEQMPARCLAPLALALLFTCTSPATAENWPQWRGERLDGISREQNLPTKWSASENIAWRLELPGPAGSTPVVFDDRIYLTSVAGPAKEDLELLCVSTAGKLLWKKTVASGSKDVRADEGNFASPSPSTDGKHVWALFGTGDLACFTKDGDEVWKFNVQDRYGKLNLQFGLASTPVLDRGRLYVQMIHGDMRGKDQEARVVCLDAASGNEIWQVDRESDGIFECKHSYASPVLYRDSQREYLLTHGNDYIVAHDLNDGRELWRCGDLNPKGKYERTLRFVASPVAVPGYIVVPTAKNYGVVCLKPDGTGDITEKPEHTHWKWTSSTPDVPSPLVVDDLVYLCRENGNLIVADAKTGKEIYTQPTTRDRHRASPFFAGGNIYLTARNGTITVVRAGRNFEIVAQNELQEPISASPVAANGRLYIRTFNALYAIGK
jgi:outer membrane protein assembly factor BamB